MGWRGWKRGEVNVSEESIADKSKLRENKVFASTNSHVNDGKPMTFSELHLYASVKWG